MKATANNKLKSINNSITNRTNQLAGSNGAAPLVTQQRVGPRGALPAWTATLVACLVVALSVCGYLLVRRNSSGEAALSQERTIAADLNMIVDRESIVHAIHSVAIMRFGPRSRFWHHRQLFAHFCESADSNDPAIAMLYERARYAPNRTALSNDELAHVRRWCKQASSLGSVQP